MERKVSKREFERLIDKWQERNAFEILRLGTIALDRSKQPPKGGKAEQNGEKGV
jgi:hypothetical protein